MKKALSIFFAFMFCFSMSALASDPHNQGGNQAQGQLQGQLQAQGQAQGQLQGNVGNTTETSYSSSEKHVRGEGLYYAAPSYTAQKGVSTSQMGNILGSITLSDSEQQEVEASRTDTLLKLHGAALIDASVMRGQVVQIVDNLEFASRPKRWLGFGWKTQGKSLENLFGILSWTSFRGNKKAE